VAPPFFCLSRYPVVVISDHLIGAFSHAALSPDPDLAVAALMIARVEYPNLDAGPYLDTLDALGREAQRRLEHAAPSFETPPLVDPHRYALVRALNAYLFEELRFTGNDAQYEDPRNSCLNEVLDRRTGIPITLALLYLEVARRAGLHVEGINFPGHFLLRCPAPRGGPYSQDLIIDAYHGGALLSEDACRELLRRHVPSEERADAEAMASASLRGHATKPQILVRMLGNLKRLYVRMHSFPQARDVTDLLLAADPSALIEIRDRGLLAYHLNDFSAALRDLQAYLRLAPKGNAEDADREEHDQIWEHVKALRRRVASMN
jgi:regulator of sirC expression with transglutaminase-like and TPR domain